MLKDTHQIPVIVSRRV